MKIHRSIKEFTGKENTSIITIGTFDGVHIGHQEIIKNLVKQGSKNDYNSVILTFFPHPRMVLQEGIDLKLLTTLPEKIALLEKTGLNNLVIEPFTKNFSRLTAVDFVRNILIKRLKLKKLVIGYDHHFGRNREGDFKQLQEYGSLYGFTVAEIPAKDIKNISVSSTKIRQALLDGDIQKANSFLGYEYLITGNVVHGKGLGTKHNYPTLNIHVGESYKLIPKPGVYVVKTTLNNRKLFGIMNIGFRPTVNGKHQTIEVHLLDFRADLYGETISISIAHRLRDEQKFDSLDDLFEQIKEDEKQARKLIDSGEISFSKKKF